MCFPNGHFAIFNSPPSKGVENAHGFYLDGHRIAIIAGASFFSSAIRIFREYERGVVFTLGRFWKVKDPGLVVIIPLIQKVIRVDLRTVVLEVPTQDVISRDNVSVKVSAVVYLRVVDPEKAIIQVVDYLNATSQLAQTMLRSVLGKHQLDDMLAEREKLNTDIQLALDAQTDSWGIKVANVEIKQVRPDGIHDPCHRQAGRGRAGTAGQGDSRRRRTAGS